MKKWSIIFLNCQEIFEVESEDVESLTTDYENFMDTINSANGEYISFICNDDQVSSKYVELLYSKCFEDFDCCFLNYKVELNLERENPIDSEDEFLSKLKPYCYEYIWSYMFKKDILKKILSFDINVEFNSKIDKLINNMTFINEVVYYHKSLDGFLSIENLPYSISKNIVYHKNMFYLNDSLTGSFSGIITWLQNIGIMFGKKYDLTILYEDAYKGTLDNLSKYYTLVQRENSNNYICDSFITTYLTYDYPKNIFYNKLSSCFVHGIMDENDCLKPDIFDKYIAVSETCAKSIKFGFDTDKKVDFIHNPFVIDKSIIKPHLKLVSTTRIEAIKGIERSKKIARILNEEGIPFTWNVFTESVFLEENSLVNSNGFIYREAVLDVLSYINDSDYLVLLSDSESFCYSVLEALALNKKVVVTPCDVFKEIGVVEGENAIFIPFEYFEDENKEKLREKVLQIYNEKDKKIKYNLVKLNSSRFSELFVK